MCTACIMARRRGFVPVAETRRRTAGVCCSVCVLYVAFHEFQRKLLAPARTSPLQILFFFNTHTKIRAYSKKLHALILARRRGFEPPEAFDLTRFPIVRLKPLSHLRIAARQSFSRAYNMILNLREKSKQFYSEIISSANFFAMFTPQTLSASAKNAFELTSQRYFLQSPPKRISIPQ